jgi:two-component system cell cycle sensor histidine kinase/response regulator CckA
VNVVIRHTKDLLSHSFDKDVEIQLELAENLWQTKLDDNHLEQVILNLCVNACDAMTESSGGIIKITTANLIQEDDSECVRIGIMDNGIGMNEDVSSRIFEPFFTTKEQGKGTGLGLAMSYGIIEQHGGSMECRSDYDVGSEFVITLPRSAETLVVKEKPKPTINIMVPTASGTSYLSTIRLLSRPSAKSFSSTMATT